MKTFFAVQQDDTFNSGCVHCLDWARQRLQETDAPIQLLSARADDKNATVVAEITRQGLRRVSYGRILPVKRLMNGKEKI